VYRLVFPNGKSYVGQTRRLPLERFDEHIKSKNNSVVQRAIDKYGAPTVKLQTLAVVSENDVDAAERIFIAAYDSLLPIGYNVAGGGRGVMTPPDPVEYTRLRCAFWSAKRAGDFEKWKLGAGSGLSDEDALAVYRYAQLAPTRYPVGQFTQIRDM
jgi:hypothetical protein